MLVTVAVKKKNLVAESFRMLKDKAKTTKSTDELMRELDEELYDD